MADDSKPPGKKQDFRESLGRFIIPPFLNDPKQRSEKWELPEDNDEPGDYIIELNLLYQTGLEAASMAFLKLYGTIVHDETRRPLTVSKSYFKCTVSANEVRELVLKDEREEDGRIKPPSQRAIYKVWPDFPVYALIDHSTATVKSDAAIRAYNATGEGIVWAVIDSGIAGGHVHFGCGNDPARKTKFCNTLYDPSVAQLHRDFSKGVPDRNDRQTYPDEASYQAALQANVDSALTDEFGHGTHVAGIIAGGLPDEFQADTDFWLCERVFRPRGDSPSHTVEWQRRHANSELVRGVAPQCKLISLKALDANGRGSTSGIMLALRYIREELNDDPKLLRVHGVNLSLGYEFDAEMFACGQSPICVEVDRLVKSGVVVVVAAGNTGYGPIGASERLTKVGISNTINDPGNAALAITVGSTHRDAPHTYGVSFFSSKGPTGDGRLKPDLVAPGERITSAATTGQMNRMQVQNQPDANRSYIDDSGTSMAAPHVSGTIAAFLSIRREFVQRPDEVKRIFLESATPLGRERYFEGHGLVDLMRAIQSV